MEFCIFLEHVSVCVVYLSGVICVYEGQRMHVMVEKTRQVKSVSESGNVRRKEGRNGSGVCDVVPDISRERP